MKTFKFIGIALFAILMCINFTSCERENGIITKGKKLTKIVHTTKYYDNTKHCEDTYEYTYLFNYDEKRRLIGVKQINNNLNYPMFIKPSNSGSSVGINIARDVESFENGLKMSLNFENKLIIEPLLENFKEFNCAIYKYQNEFIIKLHNKTIYASRLVCIDGFLF